jgi:acyl carrier protein
MSGGVAAGFQLQGVRPDVLPPSKGIRPDQPVPTPTRGIQPDRPMPKPTTADRVMAVVRTQLKVPNNQVVARDTKLVKDLKADADALAALGKEIDRQFAVEIPAAAYKKIKTVGQLIDAVEKALKDKESKPPAKKPLPPDRIPVDGGVRPGPPATFGVRPSSD